MFNASLLFHLEDKTDMNASPLARTGLLDCYSIKMETQTHGMLQCSASEFTLSLKFSLSKDTKTASAPTTGKVHYSQESHGLTLHKRDPAARFLVQKRYELKIALSIAMTSICSVYTESYKWPRRRSM